MHEFEPAYDESSRLILSGGNLLYLTYAGEINMSESIKEEETIEEMLDKCIRARSESRGLIIGQLNDLLTALNRGNPAPKTKNNEDLWVLHRDGRMVRYSNS